MDEVEKEFFQKTVSSTPRPRDEKLKTIYKGLFICFGKFILMEFANWPAVERWEHSLLTQVLTKAGFGQTGHSSLGNGKWTQTLSFLGIRQPLP